VVHEQGKSVVLCGEQESGTPLCSEDMGQQLGGGTSAAAIEGGVATKDDQLLHTSIIEVTVVPQNLDYMGKEAEVTEMPQYIQLALIRKKNEKRRWRLVLLLE
jgi:hypothetical protein